jgi:transposase
LSGNEGCRWRKQAASVHENVLRKWVKEFGSDPVLAFPGHGQMKPEQLEIERLRRKVTKLKAERDILKSIPVGLSCLAEPIAWRQIPKRRDGRPAGQGKLSCQRPEPTAHGVSGGMCWQTASNAVRTGSSG